MVEEAERTPEDLFSGFPRGLEICRAIQVAISTVGEASMTVTRSQVAFRRRRGFAYIWRPGQYVDSDVPAVLTIALSAEVKSDRFKEIAHPSANVWMHHMELHDPSELDDQVLGWLAEAHAAAG